MEDADGGFSFDFEGGLDSAAPTNPAASVADANAPAAASSAGIASSAVGNAGGGFASGGGDAPMGPGNKRSFRQTVCRHWLRSLCMKGDACGFLHQYDKARMPICRFFRIYGECREQDCVYKHTNEDVKECNMYKLGFCPNGSDCRYRHAKLAGPPPPVEEVLQKIQHLSYNYGSSNRSYQQRGTNYSQQGAQPPQGSSYVNQGVFPKPPSADSNVQQQTQNEQASQCQVQNGLNNSQSLSKMATPLPQGITRYFIVKSSNSENLELSVQQGVWATQRTNEAKLNEAFDSVEHVILIFSVNRTRHFQGCAKMTSKIGESTVGGNWKHAHGTAHYGRNFSLKWLKLCELSFQKTHHLRNPYNENLPVKISRDCQELESSIGEQLASLLYLEPDSDLMATLIAAESKREEEKAKGVNLENGAENPDIVLFEDNEEEEEEESEEDDDEGFAAVPPLAAQGRGRGRGVMWPPNMPMGRGARPLPGMRGFPPGMMGSDGFSYGPGPGHDGFHVPDPFGMGPRPFMPFGPRFSGDYGGPGPGMMFPPRFSQPGPVFPGGGFGMMMHPGPGRGPMMGGMGMGMGPTSSGPGNRPMGIPPFAPQSGGPHNRPVKRDLRVPAGDWNNNQYGGPGPEQVEDENSQQHSHHQSSRPQGDGKSGTVTSSRNEESESEDEAPRRSRHKQR